MKTLILDGLWGGHSRWEGLRRRIERDVGPCGIWRYENSGKTSLEVVAGRLVEELESRNGGIGNLVGYSMGGLVVREALRQSPGLGIRRAAFLHSPHRGSLVAHLLPFPAFREMRPGSRFLRRLNEADWRVPTLATWCSSDLMIVPGFSACWERAEARHHCAVPAHAWPVVSRRVHDLVVRFLTPGN